MLSLYFYNIQITIIQCRNGNDIINEIKIDQSHVDEQQFLDLG